MLVEMAAVYECVSVSLEILYAFNALNNGNK